MLPREKIKFEVFKLLEMHSNCQSYNYTSFYYFTIPLGGPFWLLGGGGACAPRAPPAPCLRAWNHRFRMTIYLY